MIIGYKTATLTTHGWRHKLNGDYRSMCGVEAKPSEVVEGESGWRCGSKSCKLYFRMLEETSCDT